MDNYGQNNYQLSQDSWYLTLPIKVLSTYKTNLESNDIIY